MGEVNWFEFVLPATVTQFVVMPMPNAFVCVCKRQPV
jgi:hypothetical protein